MEVKPWDSRSWSLGDFNRAADVVRSGPLNDPDYDAALEKVQHWRSSYRYPMFAARMTLANRAHKVDPKAMVVQRLKRLSSISAKLARFGEMKLTRMQDIGGCRAIVQTVRNCRDIHSTYQGEKTLRVNDYIEHPKPDGYRGIHIVTRYSGSGAKLPLDGRAVELQIRTVYQHLWATAVEVVDSVRSDRLKSGAGDAKWARFFVLAAAVFAIAEDCPQVPGTGTLAQVMNELMTIAEEINAVDMLLGFATSLKVVEQHKAVDHTAQSAYILQLDTKERTVRLVEFQGRYRGMERAQSQLFGMERGDEDPNIQTVLVHASSLQSLKLSYRNYFLDASDFARMIHHAIQTFRKSRSVTYSVVAPAAEAPPLVVVRENHSFSAEELESLATTALGSAETWKPVRELSPPLSKRLLLRDSRIGFIFLGQVQETKLGSASDVQNLEWLPYPAQESSAR